MAIYVYLRSFIARLYQSQVVAYIYRQFDAAYMCIKRKFFLSPGMCKFDIVTLHVSWYFGIPHLFVYVWPKKEIHGQMADINEASVKIIDARSNLKEFGFE